MRITICVSLREKNKLTKMNVIRSRDHEIFTETVNKIALSSEDDKRVIKKSWDSYSRTWTQRCHAIQIRVAKPKPKAKLEWNPEFKEINSFVLFWRDLSLVLCWRGDSALGHLSLWVRNSMLCTTQTAYKQNPLFLGETPI